MIGRSSIYRKTLINFHGIKVPVSIWAFDHELEVIKANSKYTDYIKITSSPTTIIEFDIKKVEGIEPLNEVRHQRSLNLIYPERFSYFPTPRSQYDADTGSRPIVKYCLLAFKPRDARSLIYKILDNQTHSEDLFLTSISLFAVIEPKFAEFKLGAQHHKLYFAEYLLS